MSRRTEKVVYGILTRFYFRGFLEREFFNSHDYNRYTLGATRNPPMLNQILILFLFLSPISLNAQQTVQSHNPCDEKPTSQRQMNDCAAFEYEQADEHLNMVYGKAMKYMTDDQARAEKKGNQQQIEYEKTAVASLKQSERAWLTYRDLQCKAAGKLYEGGSMRGMIESGCLTTLTKNHIADIKAVYEDGDRKLE